MGPFYSMGGVLSRNYWSNSRGNVWKYLDEKTFSSQPDSFGLAALSVSGVVLAIVLLCDLLQPMMVQLDRVQVL